MRGPIRHLLILAVLVFAVPLRVSASPAVPVDFVVENAYPGLVFITPTAIAFTPDGRLLVAEKRGMVRIVEGGTLRAQPMWNGAREVLNSGDRGLIGIAVDPDYARNHRVYFFYTADPDSDGVDDEIPAFSRLVRYETAALDSNVVDPSTRTVLIGSTWRDGIPSPTLSHAVDCLRWGEDGSLLVSHGEGAHYEVPDAGQLDPMQFGVGRSDPAEDIGSFRAQDMGSLAGKILRINPENGHGYASNPFADGNLASNRSRVWAYGFRNPFRFCVRPGSGSPDTSAGAPGVLYVGDVGAGKWEELDIVVTPGSNFGWPCFEGPQPNLVIDNVEPAHHDCSSVGTPQNPSIPVSPPLRWEHADSTQSLPVGLVGNCTAGGIFYSGARYPEHYRGRLFFGDFGAGWLRVGRFDDSQVIVSVQDFGAGLEGPVDWAIDPVSEELLYVSINTGEVRRFRYVGATGELPIVAQASAYPPTGSAPESVALSSLGSDSPAGEGVRFSWSFGDGTMGSNEAHPVHLYGAGEFAAVLTVAGDGGRIARDTVNIVIAAHDFPVAGVLDAFARADGPIAAPWTGSISGLAVRDSALVQTSTSSYATWNGGIMEANQEVFVQLESITPDAPEHALLLKAQSTSWSAGVIHVVYDVKGSVVVVNTYAPAQGWVRRSAIWRGVRFNAGDVFGARAYSNGIVNVYRNDEVIGRTSVVGWPFVANGGRIGIMLKGASSTRLVGFGGGSVGIRTNQPPVASILSPLDGSFYARGEPIVLRGAGADSDDPDSSLAFRWSVTLRHNNHLHPDVHTFATAVASFEPDNHDDDTGVNLMIRLMVTDARGASDTAMVAIAPEVEPAGLPATLRLSSAIPNPTPGNVWFEVELPQSARVRWAVFDINGREVWSVPWRVLEAGRSRLHWPSIDHRGNQVPVGLYMVRVTLGDSVYLRRLTILH